MYELTVERIFCAAHSILIANHQEPTHGHNWHVRVTVEGDTLDSNGLLCDFHLLERELERVIGPWNNGDLNRTPAFDRVNPTAELVVKHIAVALAPSLPQSVRLQRVSVTEAPGCVATWVNRSRSN